MIEFDVQSDASQFHDALVSFIKEKQVPVADALRFQGRLLGKRLIEFTPPQTRVQGKLAVERDIRRWLKGTNLKSIANNADIYLSQNLYPTKGKTPEDRKASRRAVKAVRQRVQGRDVVRVFATKEGRVYGIDLERFWPNRSMEDFAAIHRANRDARGRGATAWDGLDKHKPLLEAIFQWPKSTPPKLSSTHQPNPTHSPLENGDRKFTSALVFGFTNACNRQLENRTCRTIAPLDQVDPPR